jgi:hypothetical protein
MTLSMKWTSIQIRFMHVGQLVEELFAEEEL